MEVDPEDRHLTVLYGTQTGNAQDVAERIAREGLRKRFTVAIKSLDEYEKTDLIGESLVIFVISTTGNGDFPTTALPFWRFLLRDGLPTDILSDVTYAVFGLGDTSYQRFCWPARKLGRRLQGLGAQELLPSGEADDQHYLGIDGALQPWLDDLWSTLADLLPLPAGLESIPDDVILPPHIEVRVLEGVDNGSVATASGSNGAVQHDVAKSNGRDAKARDTAPHAMRWARLTRNERMTAEDHWQDVRQIEWETEDGGDIEYEAGDVASLRPENPPEDVDCFIRRMGWIEDADKILELSSTDPGRPLPPHLPSHLTLRELLTKYLDPFSVPRKSFFELVRHFSPAGSMEREKLDEFCTPGEGADEMYEYAQRVSRTIAEVLEEFKTIDVPLKWVCEILPQMRERQFSIASGPSVHRKTIQLAVAIVKYKTRLKEPRKGVCTAWLSRLEPGSRIPFRIERGTMQLPSDPSVPIMLVGPGTGVAPMRAFVQERTQQNALDNLLFLGCRNSSRDFLYGSEWAALANSQPPKVEYHLAPSRDGDDKIYVQDRIREQAQRVWKLVGEQMGVVYISGSSGKMPEAVREAVKHACMSCGDMDADQAERYLLAMEAQRRWQEECWS